MCKKLLITLFLLFICLDALLNSAPSTSLKKKKKKGKCGALNVDPNPH